jgi:hypothetical protein
MDDRTLEEPSGDLVGTVAREHAGRCRIFGAEQRRGVDRLRVAFDDADPGGRDQRRELLVEDRNEVAIALEADTTISIRVFSSKAAVTDGVGFRGIRRRVVC